MTIEAQLFHTLTVITFLLLDYATGWVTSL